MQNAASFSEFFYKSVLYLAGLNTTTGENVLDTRRKTGFKVLLITMQSVGNMFKDLVKKKLVDMLTYKVSQGHIDMFFASISSMGGFNNNPTVKQFEGAYKRLLLKTELETTSTNCAVVDDTFILMVSSSGNKSDLVTFCLAKLATS